MDVDMRQVAFFSLKNLQWANANRKSDLSSQEIGPLSQTFITTCKNKACLIIILQAWKADEAAIMMEYKLIVAVDPSLQCPICLLL